MNGPLGTNYIPSKAAIADWRSWYADWFSSDAALAWMCMVLGSART